MVAEEVRAYLEASQLLNTSAAISRGGFSLGARDVVNPSVSWWSRERRLLLISDERMKDSGDCDAEVTLPNNNNQTPATWTLSRTVLPYVDTQQLKFRERHNIIYYILRLQVGLRKKGKSKLEKRQTKRQSNGFSRKYRTFYVNVLQGGNALVRWVKYLSVGAKNLSLGLRICPLVCLLRQAPKGRN